VHEVLSVVLQEGAGHRAPPPTSAASAAFFSAAVATAATGPVRGLGGLTASATLRGRFTLGAGLTALGSIGLVGLLPAFLTIVLSLPGLTALGAFGVLGFLTPLLTIAPGLTLLPALGAFGLVGFLTPLLTIAPGLTLLPALGAFGLTIRVRLALPFAFGPILAPAARLARLGAIGPLRRALCLTLFAMPRASRRSGTRTHRGLRLTLRPIFLSVSPGWGFALRARLARIAAPPVSGRTLAITATTTGGATTFIRGGLRCVRIRTPGLA
jgi:hypothetical protein